MGFRGDISGRVGLTAAIAAVAILAYAGPQGSPPSALDLVGRPVDPFSEESGASVLLFVRTDCPISNRYAPEVNRLHKKFAAQGVAFWLVYPDAGESAEAIRKHVSEFDLQGVVLRDPYHVLVQASGVTITPEAAVYKGHRRLLYRGRIDDRYVDFGRARPAPTTHDLEQALEAVLAGKPVRETRTRAVGCYISDLR